MTKLELINVLDKYNDDDHVYVEIHDALLSDDLYHFEIDDVVLSEGVHEIRISVIPNTMNAFTNIFEEFIEYKPFYHNACGVWRIARYINGSVDIVFENESYKNEQTCKERIKIKYNDNE